MGNFANIDWIVFLLYFVIVSAYGYWIYTRKRASEQTSAEFFLAEGSLTWWAIGASLIASNISTEQIVGMSSSGFAMGLAIASYEWMAAATLVVVAIFFLPIYLRNKIYTMPQFLTQRYNGTVAMVLAVFWLLVFVFVNLTSILHLGANTISTMTGFPYMYCILGLAAFAIIITIGGMQVIGYTDVFQVLVLVAGGIVATWLALNKVAEIDGGSGFFAGLATLRQQSADHFHLIFSPGQMMMPDGSGGTEDAYNKLPGLAVLIGAMWIANLSYWGCNQYITQRALGANLKTARSGLLFAAFIKIFMPIIVVLPGIAIYHLYKTGNPEISKAIMGVVDGSTTPVVRPDNTYSSIISLLPNGAIGLVLAALVAAIVASLAGKANSIATIFALDIYKKIRPNTPDDRLVPIGRYTIWIAMAVAVLVAPVLQHFGQVFQFIQDFTGLISPGVVAIFLLGMFWRGNTANAALLAAIATIPLGFAIESLLPGTPFMNRMGYVFLALIVLQVLVSLVDPARKNQKGIEIDTKDFQISGSFALGAVTVCGLLAVIYTLFW